MRVRTIRINNVSILLAGVIGCCITCGVFASPGSDFNGDGFDDLVVGVPGEDAGGIADCGCVQVFHGSALGLSAVADQFRHQGRTGVLDTNETGDAFGSVIGFKRWSTWTYWMPARKALFMRTSTSAVMSRFPLAKSIRRVNICGITSSGVPG